MRIAGVVLIVMGMAVLGGFALLQRAQLSNGRRRVRFARAMELTAPVVVTPARAPLYPAPDDRGVVTRVVGLLWIVVLIVFLSLVTAGILWGTGAAIVKFVTDFASNA